MTSGNFKPPYLPLYLTLDSIPVERFCRTIVIPDDPAWVGLVDGILSALTDPKVWRQFGTLTPEEMADAWLDMLTESWETDEMACCPEFARDPSTGLLMQSDDGGITFFRVPDGPYIPGDGPFSAPPPPLGQGSDEADRCQAAWNATAVINQFYKETIGQVTLDLWNTVLDVNRFLFQVNNTLLQMVYPDAVQLGLAQDINAFPWADYTDLPQLNDEQQQDVACLIFENATVTDGVVSLDYAAILDGLDDVLGENPGTAVQILLEYMGEPGLNTAGGVMAVSDPNCEECGVTEITDFQYYNSSTGAPNTNHWTYLGDGQYSFEVLVQPGDTNTYVNVARSGGGGFAVSGATLSPSGGVGTTSHNPYPSGATIGNLNDGDWKSFYVSRAGTTPRTLTFTAAPIP